MERIKIDNISAGGKCNLFHHGVVLDYIQKKTFEFQKGKIYGIIGEFGYGGAALSCAISGNTNLDEGSLFINDIEQPIQKLWENSWYVGNDLYSYNSKTRFTRRNRFSKNTIREQIDKGLKVTNSENTTDIIKEMFEISEERIDRNINYVSGERWKASVAIGYANGKKIFCYPWMNTRDVEHLQGQLCNTVKVLIENNCIVIIPTTRGENVSAIYSEFSNIIL